MSDSGQDLIDVGSVLRETYAITSELGRGGMGTVYLANHLRLPGKQVAVKVLQGARASEEVRTRFQREARIVSLLGHPNIVDVLDFNTLEHGTPYLVLEYLRGESLQRRLKQGPLPVAVTFDIVRQVGSALHSAHKAGVVHRDLKPDNIFLVPTDSGGVVAERVKLLDFGISKISDADSSLKTQDAVLMGTPQYMAPEQALGRNSQVDARTDLFALGCIVYEMLSGKGPFAGNLVAEVVYRVVHTEPPPLDTLFPSLDRSVVLAIERAMKKDPAQRFASVAEFVTELTGSPLRSLSQDAVPVATRAEGTGHVPSGITFDPTLKASVLPPARPSSGRKRSAWLLSALALGLAGGILAPLLLRSRTLELQPTPPAYDPTPVDEKVPVPVPTLTPPAAPTKPAHVEPSRREPTPVPEAVADLKAAEAALGRGDALEALRLARHSQSIQVRAQSFSVLVRAHCLQSDLSNAHAQWPKVPASERASVRALCKADGIELPL